MNTWATLARSMRPSACREVAARSSAPSSLFCAVDTGEALEPAEYDPMRFCADPTVRLTLVCSAPGHETRAWHPWEG